MNTETVPSDIQSFALEVLRKLDQGVTINWTDIRLPLVVVFATIIGSILGGYFFSYFRKRGEIAAIKKDLDKITQIQEDIKASISTKAWIDQNWWNLKRDTYWKITQALNSISDALWNLLHFGFSEDKSIIAAIYGSFEPQLTKAIDEYLQLTGIAHIVFSDNAISIIKDCSSKIKDINKRFQSKNTYEYFESIRSAYDEAYNSIISIAQKDLKGKTIDHD